MGDEVLTMRQIDEIARIVSAAKCLRNDVVAVLICAEIVRATELTVPAEVLVVDEVHDLFIGQH